MYLINGPYLQDAKKDSVMLMWELDEKAVCRVRVYKAMNPQLPACPNPVEESYVEYRTETEVLHKVLLNTLLPETDYCYEIFAESGGSLTGRIPFRTAPNEETPFSFILTAEHGGVGDPTGPYTRSMIDQMKFEHPDFLLSVGDILSNGQKRTEWSTYLFTPYRDILCTTPFYPCVGNHEVGTNSVPDNEMYRYDNFHRYFSFAHYYSFDYGCAHFCVLDTPAMFCRIDRNEAQKDNYIPRMKDDFMNSEQVHFLKDDLQKTDKKWKFVVFHYPPYTSAHYDVRDLRCLAPIFEQYGVDIVFNSHAIVYERSHPVTEGKVAKCGVRYILVGGFGKFDHWFRPKSNGLSAKLSGNRPNFVRVALSPYRLELEAIDWEGRRFDALVIDKD